MNGTGSMAAPFISVTGLTDQELPVSKCPSGVLHAVIPSLCVGSSQDLRHNAVGYVSFLRGNTTHPEGKTTDQINFEYYREAVLIPFITTIREKLFGHSPGTDIPIELTAFGLVDEINAIFLDLKHRGILLLKHNKESALKDFISAYPSMIGRAAPTSSVAKGFLSNGMLDKRTMFWPDYDAIRYISSRNWF
mmetsp:Transcript_22410/g.25830  ORF Transcript_22410/g.25830 Transcript_22410/m.25830 type:complete len:192 (-) Transcript_22410:151-726(-)